MGLVLLVTMVKQSQLNFEVELEFDKKNVFQKKIVEKNVGLRNYVIGHKKFVDPKFFHPKKMSKKI